jgi:bacterioferritin
MKGNDKIITQLNARLSEELTAVNQYFVHAEMCDNWKYARLHEVIRKRSIVEMKHAEKLIERILFLEGIPIVSNLGLISIGAEVQEMHKHDLDAENSAVKGYNETIKLAAELMDNGTKDLLESILDDEEGHVDWIEAQFDQIKQVGIQNYLTEQIR